MAQPSPTPRARAACALLSKSAALHCARHGYGIRVNTIHPGYIDTPMMDFFDEETIDDVISRHPLGRLGKPREIADAALYLQSDESRFVTGSEFVIDGGFTAL